MSTKFFNNYRSAIIYSYVFLPYNVDFPRIFINARLKDLAVIRKSPLGQCKSYKIDTHT